jgi:hypothetical protein
VRIIFLNFFFFSLVNIDPYFMVKARIFNSCFPCVEKKKKEKRREEKKGIAGREKLCAHTIRRF